MSENSVVQQVVYPYLSALMYMHRRGIIHRDIKPENTVFTRENVLKVTGEGDDICEGQGAQSKRPAEDHASYD